MIPLKILQLGERLAVADWSKQRTNQTRHSFSHIAFDSHLGVNLLPSFGHYPMFTLRGVSNKKYFIMFCCLQILRYIFHTTQIMKTLSNVVSSGNMWHK